MLKNFVGLADENNASDIHLTGGKPPKLRIDGELQAIKGHEDLNQTDMEKVFREANVFGNERAEQIFKETLNYDGSLEMNGFRLRVHAYQTRGELGMVLRMIPLDIPELTDLNLPPVVKTLVDLPNGLGIVTGVTGSGKSTTLAALVNEINKKYRKKIVTIEDPVEFVYNDLKSEICQRELGNDVITFRDGVRAAMREDPDIILVGELRDLETIEAALTLAETGHLVLGTSHTRSTVDVFSRLVSEFSGDMQDKARYQLAANISFVLGQKLARKKGGGRVPICELLLPDDSIRFSIRDNKAKNAIRSTIKANSKEKGSLLFEQSASYFYHTGVLEEGQLEYFFTEEEREEVIKTRYDYNSWDVKEEEEVELESESESGSEKTVSNKKDSKFRLF